MFVNLSKFLGVVFLISAIASCHSQATVEKSPQILLPLYIYPNWYEPENYVWSKVATASTKVPIVAIINPNNGPDGNPPNEDYQKGLAELKKANTTILGYVYTEYGDRPKAEVIQDILLYARHYNVDGIFIDETSSNARQVDYYQDIYNYIKQNTYLDRVVINPGTSTDEAYLTKPAADTAVIFENYPQSWEDYQSLPYISNYNAKSFAILIHSVSDVNQMKEYIDLAIERNIGYVYITDDSPQNDDGDPWNSLPSYWEEEIDYLKSKN